MRNSTKGDSSHYMATDLTTESLAPHFTLQSIRESRGLNSENSDYSKVIVVVAILIFVFAIIIAIFIMLMQRRSHRRKLLLAAEIEKEEEDDRKRRLARMKHTPKRTPRKKKRMKRMGTPKSRKFDKPKTKEEIMMELSDFLETRSKKYGTPNEASVGSVEPTPAPTPTVTPGLLSSEVDVSFHTPVAADSRSPKLLSEDKQYHRISKKPHIPEYEKEVIHLTPSTEWGEKSEKKLAEVPSVPATPPSKSASPTHIETGITGSRQPTPTAIDHGESRKNKSRELRSWNLESAEKEGYAKDRALEPWEEELQPSEKAEKEDEV